MGLDFNKIVRFSSSVLVTFSAGVLRAILGNGALPKWYEELKKAPFNPENDVFRVVWVVLYSLQALALYLIWESPVDYDKKKKAVTFYFIQLGLNMMWSITFFAFQNAMGAFFIMIAMWGFVFITILKFFKIRRLAALLLAPYLLWISFASVLNFYIATLN